MNESVPFMRSEALSDVRVCYDIDTSGKHSETVTTEITLPDNAKSPILMCRKIQFDRTCEEIEILGAHIHRATGMLQPIDTSLIISHPTYSGRPAAMFSNGRELTVPFPNVRCGDRVVLSYRRSVIIPQLEGHFSIARLIPTATKDRLIVELRAPVAMTLHDSSSGFCRTAKLDEKVQLLRFESIVNVVGSEDPLAEFRVSTCATHEEFGQTYLHALAPRVKALPSVAEMAIFLTENCQSEEDQVKALYSWIKSNIAVVNSVPQRRLVIANSPAITLGMREGNASDHAVLFASFLQSCGIPCELALVARDRGRIAALPVFDELNNIVVWLPGMSTYADTTSQTGMNPVRNGKQRVLHLTQEPAILCHSPPVDWHTHIDTLGT